MKSKPEKLVGYELDFKHLPPLTEAQEAELAALDSLPDEAIDYSDIPRITDTQWKNAVRGRFNRPPAQHKETPPEPDKG